MTHLPVKKLSPVIVLFILINVLVFIFGNSMQSAGFNPPFLLAANAVLFLLTLFGFIIQAKGANSRNINGFIRGVYSSLLLKMFVIVGAILVYIVIMGGQVNKPSLFTSMAIYLIYTSIEVIQLMNIARKKPDA